MAYIKFKDSEEFLPAVVELTGNNTVKITTDMRDMAYPVCLHPE